MVFSELFKFGNPFFFLFFSTLLATLDDPRPLNSSTPVNCFSGVETRGIFIYILSSSATAFYALRWVAI